MGGEGLEIHSGWEKVKREIYVSSSLGVLKFMYLFVCLMCMVFCLHAICASRACMMPAEARKGH